MESMLPQSVASQITDLMIEHEFHAAPKASGTHVEYFREIVEPDGRHLRITLLFERPRGGYGPNKPRFAGAHVSVSKFWRPEDRADLASNAPEGIRALLGEIYGKLEAVCGDASLSLVERSCSICGYALTTFREGPDGPTCLDPLSCDKATL